MGITVIATGKAKNWYDLGHALGVTTRTIQNWRQNPNYADTLPRCGSKGEKDVAAWINFMVLHGLKEAVAEDDGEQPPIKFIPGNDGEYKKLLTYEKIKQAQIETGKMEGVLLESAALEVQLGAAFVAITNRVSGLADSLAPLVVARTDVAEIIEIIRPETDSILAGLNCADYLAGVDELSHGLECTEDERKRTIELVEQVLRGIGSKAIEALLRPSTVDPISGQARNIQHAPEE